MNKKAQFPSLLQSTVAYIILTAVFVGFIFMMVYHYKNATAPWEEFYAKEIARAVNMAEAGDLVTIDLNKASVIAKKNNFEEYAQIVRFDNKNHEIIIKLGANGETRFSYFNDVEISDVKTILGVPTNILQFRVYKCGVECS